MRYFHIQLRPDRAIGVDTVKAILKEKGVIGVGSTNQDASAFRNQPHIGDIVVVREGAIPIALTQIASECYEELNVDSNLDWFDLRRKVEILEFYKDSGTFPQPRGTFSICSDLNNSTSTFIIDWYKRYLMDNLIENCILDNEKKKIFIEFFENFSKEWKGVDENVADESLSIWKNYVKKINDAQNPLPLQEFTNIKKTPTTEYLCEFLERRTRVFGASRPGSSNQYMVKKNRDDDNYYIKYEKKNEKEDATEKEAEDEYKQNILPLLKAIASAYSKEKIVQLEQNPLFKRFEASQILRKMVVLNNGYNEEFALGFFYVDDLVDDLMDYFFNEDYGNEFGFFEKSNAIILITKHILDEVHLFEGMPWNKQIHLMSAFLWNFGSSNGLTSDKAPNVILYGPPGTGKTFSVQNTIDFLTKGDAKRVCFTQFHPSFTYEDFIDGLKPAGVTSNGNVRFELVNGIFKDFCIRAKNDAKNVYYFVVDEINRANLSTVFGETLSLLEKDYRWVQSSGDGNKKYLKLTQNSALHSSMITMLENDLTSAENDQEKEKIQRKIGQLIGLAFDYDSKTKEVKFAIPKNVHFIGMMNDVDKSIDSFDLALRRRFRWKEMECDYEVIEDSFKVIPSNLDDYIQRCQNLNAFISGSKKIDSKTGLGLGKSYEFGHSYFMKVPVVKKRISKSARNNLFVDYLQPTLKEYLRGFYEESDIPKRIAEAKSIFVDE